MRADATGVSSPLVRGPVEHELRQHNCELALVNAVLLKIGGSLDLSAILNGALEVTLEFMRFDVGCIFLVDEGGKEIALSARRSAQDRPARRCGHALASVSAVFTLLESVHVVEDVQDVQTDGQAPEAVRALLEDGAISLVSVPLRTRGSRLGLLVLGNHQRRRFSPREIHLLATLGGQIGAAVENARLYEEQKQALDEMQSLNRAMILQQTIYDRLIGQVLEGHGIDSLVETLSELVGNPVSVENQYFRPIARSHRPDAQPFAREEPALGPPSILRAPKLRQHFDLLAERRHPMPLTAFPEYGLDEPRVIAPIFVDGDLLGYVSILEVSRPLQQGDLTGVQQASIIFALEMMKAKVAAEVEHRLRGELLHDLLSGSYHSESAMLSRAAYLGHDLTLPHALLVVDIDELSYTIDSLGTAEDRVLVLKRRLFDVVKSAVAHSYPSSLVVSRSDSVVILVEKAAKVGPHRGEQGSGEEMALAKHIKSEVERCTPELSVSISIGSTCHKLEDYRLSYDRAYRSLAAIKSMQRRGAIVDGEQLGVYHLLFDHNNQHELLRFADRMIGPLVAYDKEHNTDLVKTLDKYLRQDCRLESTASELSIHRSTLLYRLQRIEEIGKLDLRDPDVRFNAQLALRIWSVAGLE